MDRDLWESDPKNLRFSDRIWLENRSKRKRRRGTQLRRLTREQWKKRAELELERLVRHSLRAPGEIRLETLRRLYVRQDGHCYYCRSEFRLRVKRVGMIWWNARFHIEHKQPVSRGGTNAEHNLALACPRCNREKFTMTEDEYRVFCSRPKPKKKVVVRSPERPENPVFQPLVLLRKKGSKIDSEQRTGPGIAQRLDIPAS